MIAGRDTTATLLSWMLWEVCQHPEMLVKARAEIADVLDGNPMSFDDVSCFEYLRAIQNETLRLHPSVPRDLRFAENDDVFPDGTKVKAGTGIAYVPYVMGRDPTLWGDDCLEFKPERWESILAASFGSQTPSSRIDSFSAESSPNMSPSRLRKNTKM